MRQLFAIGLLLTLTVSVARADSRSVLFKAGRIYLDPATVVENGAVLVKRGRIAWVGKAADVDEDAAGVAELVENPSGTITCGLIDANAAVGFASPGNKVEHRTECIPELKVIETLDLESRGFRKLAESGVSIAYVSADSASVIGGRGALLRTAGPAARRVLKDAYAVKATLGREPITKAARNRRPFFRTSFMTRRPNTRMGLVWVFRKSFHDAQMFSRGDVPGTRGEGAPKDESIPFLVQVLKGEIPLRIQARAQLDILTAIRMSREFNVPFILEEGTDAYLCIDELVENKVPVIYGPLFDYPVGGRAFTGEVNKYRYSTPAALVKAGVPMALSANDQTGEASLPQQAMMAMRFGLSRAEALAAVTTVPAQLLEIDDTAGRIETGRIADVVLWSGEPFDATTRADAVMVAGRLVANRLDSDTEESHD